jgi:hypothetical protein
MNRSPIPPAQVCPLCGNDDGVVVNAIANPNSWTYVCNTTGLRHTDPYQWQVIFEDTPALERSGITQELGLYDDLPHCLTLGEPWVEYGIVEYRFKEAFPRVYLDELIPRYSHRSITSKPYTLSAFVASALAQLRSEGTVVHKTGPATGYWAYNGEISYWALPPPPALENTMTWVQFSEVHNLDPENWKI